MTPPDSSAAAVETRGLKRVFKGARGAPDVVALDGVDLRIERGEVFGLLGPNGAGKTTFLKILTTLLYPTTGWARVAGYDVVREPREYEALAVFGGILSTYWINVLWGMGSQFYWEKQQGQLQLYFAAPCSRMAILTGMAVGGIS